MSEKKLSPIDQLIEEWGNWLDASLPVKTSELGAGI